MKTIYDNLHDKITELENQVLELEREKSELSHKLNKIETSTYFKDSFNKMAFDRFFEAVSKIYNPKLSFTKLRAECYDHVREKFKNGGVSPSEANQID